METVYDLIPPDLREASFIAGGYAACPALARDIDVWVPMSSPVAQNDIVMLAAVREAVKAFVVETVGAAAFIEEIDADHDTRYALNTVRVGIVRVEGWPLIHIMVSDGCVQQVIDAFDISTHMVATTFDGHTLYGTHYTEPGLEPVIRDGAITSLERVNKIRTRYGFPPVASVEAA